MRVATDSNQRCQDNGSSSAVGARAEFVAILYLRRAYPGAIFVPCAPGADLAILHEGVKCNFEVKGTRSTGIELNTLKVSSRHSHRLLQEGMPLLRIYNVFTLRPVVAVLICGRDFILREEPRWAAKPVPNTSRQLTVTE